MQQNQNLNVIYQVTFPFLIHTVWKDASYKKLQVNFSVSQYFVPAQLSCSSHKQKHVIHIWAQGCPLTPPPCCHVVNKLALRSLKILSYTVLSSHLLEGMLQLQSRETPTACHILKEDTKQQNEGGGLCSHCWGVVTRRTCIITDFLSLSFWLSFPERCKWCVGQSLSRPTSRNRPLQQGLWR